MRPSSQLSMCVCEEVGDRMALKFKIEIGCILKTLSFLQSKPNHLIISIAQLFITLSTFEFVPLLVLKPETNKFGSRNRISPKFGIFHLCFQFVGGRFWRPSD